MGCWQHARRYSLQFCRLCVLNDPVSLFRISTENIIKGATHSFNHQCFQRLPTRYKRDRATSCHASPLHNRCQTSNKNTSTTSHVQSCMSSSLTHNPSCIICTRISHRPNLVGLQILGDSGCNGWTAVLVSTCDDRSPALSKCVFRMTVTGQNVRHRRDKRWTLESPPCNRVALRKLVLLVLIEFVDLCRCKLACRYLLGEENVEFVEAPIL